MRRAASRADCTAGKSRAMRTAMMEMTTSNSINVKPDVVYLRCIIRKPLRKYFDGVEAPASGRTEAQRQGAAVEWPFELPKGDARSATEPPVHPEIRSHETD